ncbi:type II toxin-antitoxin system RelE/ParE family toxin [Sphingomonas hankookensis]|uniref:Plasmid stabilization protein n=1 Tax=Sphingomonas hengshuiensis TaxID=1609977 RepID=A0A2W5B786_9SPHN|nr:MAG: plasmid stabilization protein [Sphingomonas hengshuiensis]
MRVVLTPQAQADLRRIALWIANDNPRRAISFVDELRHAAQALAGLPHGYPLIPRYERQGIRRRSYRRYVILYAVRIDRIIVLRFLEPGRDLDRALGLR